ncbi:hypothetical protein R70241_04422 [Paraburkholderia saeva]|nr:hypothetical protein R70241_04422 [Paraburkholderia saeva]
MPNRVARPFAFYECPNLNIMARFGARRLGDSNYKEYIWTPP